MKIAGIINNKKIELIYIETEQFDFSFVNFFFNKDLYKYICKCLSSGISGLCFAKKSFLKKEKNTSKNRQNSNIQKKKGEIVGFKILVFIIEIDIKDPKR